jgi:hypothetical protein
VHDKVPVHGYAYFLSIMICNWSDGKLVTSSEISDLAQR